MNSWASSMMKSTFGVRLKLFFLLRKTLLMTSAVWALASSASGRLMTKTRGEPFSVESISSGRVSQGTFPARPRSPPSSTTLLRASKVFFRELVAEGREEQARSG